MNGRKLKFKATSADKKRFMRSLHKFLNDNEWEIKLGWSKNNYGLCHYENETIYINFCFAVASILIHEFLHAKYISLSERNVEKLEARISKSLSDRQIRNLAIKVMIGRKITEQDFKKISDD